MTLPAMEKHGLIEACIFDATSYPKKGKHCVDVARHITAISASWTIVRARLRCPPPIITPASLTAIVCICRRNGPMTEVRRKKVGVPEDVTFKTKTEIALDIVKQGKHTVRAAA